MDYREKIVIVTGASSGIGYVTAKAFANRSATVIGASCRDERLQPLFTAAQDLRVPICIHTIGTQINPEQKFVPQYRMGENPARLFSL